jgi:hypothetical protein
MIKQFIATGDLFGSMLAEERRIAARIDTDGDNAESVTERLFAMQAKRREARNELDALRAETIAEVRRRGGDPAIVTRPCVVAWNYIGRFNDVWIEAKAQLQALLLLPDTDPWLAAIACLSGPQLAVAESLKSSSAGLTYLELADSDDDQAFIDGITTESAARQAIYRIRKEWKEQGVPFEIPKTKKGGKLTIRELFSTKT